MANDAHWPGPNNTYPFWPRDSNGDPLKTGGLEYQLAPGGGWVQIDTRARTPDGQFIQDVAPRLVRVPGNGAAKRDLWLIAGSRVETFTATAPNGQQVTVVRNIDTGEQDTA